jgi:hypothetical protein
LLRVAEIKFRRGANITLLSLNALAFDCSERTVRCAGHYRNKLARCPDARTTHPPFVALGENVTHRRTSAVRARVGMMTEGARDSGGGEA